MKESDLTKQTATGETPDPLPIKYPDRPRQGSIQTLDTPKGPLFFRVVKVTRERVTLVALTRAESIEIVARLQAIREEARVEREQRAASGGWLRRMVRRFTR